MIAGARGCLREVFFGSLDLNRIRAATRSSRSSIQERLYRHNRPEFGEHRYFGHRFSGFFVPPTTSLYTFNLNSDDNSRLYFSSDPYIQNERLIIHVGRYTAFR